MAGVAARVFDQILLVVFLGRTELSGGGYFRRDPPPELARLVPPGLHIFRSRFLRFAGVENGGGSVPHCCGAGELLGGQFLLPLRGSRLLEILHILRFKGRQFCRLRVSVANHGDEARCQQDDYDNRCNSDWGRTTSILRFDSRSIFCRPGFLLKLQVYVVCSGGGWLPARQAMRLTVVNARGREPETGTEIGQGLNDGELVVVAPTPELRAGHTVTAAGASVQ